MKKKPTFMEESSMASRIWFSNNNIQMSKNRKENRRFFTSPRMKPSGSLRFSKILETNGSLISLCFFPFKEPETSESPIFFKEPETMVL
jgi:hypothetical protein